jgi:PPOX class probable F420-dependent enzyme
MSMPIDVIGACPRDDAARHDAVVDRPLAADPAFARIDRMLRGEAVVWLSSVRPDGRPHLVPIWFSWDGESILIASKPHARKVLNLRHSPTVMLAVGEPEDDFDVGMIEGVAELLAKYRERMAAIGLGPDEFLATYSQVIRIRPTRFLPWHGRTAREADPGTSIDRRIAAAIRRVAAGLETGPAVSLAA